MRRAFLFTVLLGLPVAACDSGSDPVLPASIQIADEVDVLLVGQTWLLDVTALDENGDPIEDAELAFESDNTAAATVDDQGRVTGVGEGLANISASAGAVSDEVAIGFVDLADPCTNAVAVGFDQPVRTSFQAGDCQLDDASFVDFWFFELEDSALVDVDMAAVGVGTTLWLFNETDPEPITDDPGGENDPSATMEAELGPGFYIIAAAAWPGQTGTYTLTVDATAPAAVVAGTPRPGRDAGDLKRPVRRMPGLVTPVR